MLSFPDHPHIDSVFLGLDLLDVSSGGNHRDQKIKQHTDYQVELASQIRSEIRACGQKTLVRAIGLIKEADAACDLVQGADDMDKNDGKPMLMLY